MKPILLIAILISNCCYSQKNALSCGGEAIGLGGTASYSLGQTFDNFSFNSNYSVQEGIQQTYKINTDDLIELDPEYINIYPVPVSEFITIEINNKESFFDYFLISMNGNIVGKGKINTNVSSLNLSNFPCGEYTLLLTSNSHFFNSKIIKI
jgi:hypothetical protein